MFPAASFTGSKPWKLRSVHQQVHERACHGVQWSVYYSALRRKGIPTQAATRPDPEEVTLREVSRTPKGACRVSPLRRSPWRGPVHQDGERSGGRPGCGEAGEGSDFLTGTELELCSGEKNSRGGDGRTTLWKPSAPLNHTREMAKMEVLGYVQLTASF